MREIEAVLNAVKLSPRVRGSNILKYKAAGAEAVLIGRATLYGMAAAGEKGAVAVLNIPP